MSNKKQTAVEWFWNQIENTEPNLSWYKILDQAKEMEKHQIIDAYDLGMGHYGGVNRRSDAEQYYTDTYEN